MGFAWALLMPALTIAAGIVIRGAMVGAGGTSPSLAGIALKSWAWAFFAGALSFATTSLLSNINIVTKIYFPREVLPLGAVIAQGVDSLVGLAVLIVISPWLGISVSLQLLWLPFLLLLLLMITTGLGFLFACANIFFRDVKYIVQVLLTFGIFFTPVLLEPATLGRVGTVMMFNPLSPVLEGLRLAVVEGHNLLLPLSAGDAVVWRPWWLAYSAGCGVVLLVVGVRAFRASASRFAEAY